MFMSPICGKYPIIEAFTMGDPAVPATSHPAQGLCVHNFRFRAYLKVQGQLQMGLYMCVYIHVPKRLLKIIQTYRYPAYSPGQTYP